MIFMLSACDFNDAKRVAIRYGLEQALTSRCDGDQNCIKTVEDNLDRCVTDADLDVILKAANSELDDKTAEAAVAAGKCIFGDEPR